MIPLVLTIATVCLAVAGLLVRRDCRTGIVVTPFLFFVASEVILVWPSALQQMFTSGWPDLYPFIVILGAFGAFLIGNVLFRSVTRNDKGRAARFRAAPVLYSSRFMERDYLLGALVLALSLAATGLHYYQGTPPVAQAVYELAHGADRAELGVQVAQARAELTKSHYFGGEYRGQGFARSVLQIGGAVLVGALLVLWMRYKRHYWAILTIIAFIGSLLLIAGNGKRGPLVQFIVVLFTLFAALKPVAWRYALIAACTTLAVFGSLSLINNKIRSVPAGSNIATHAAGIIFNRFAYGTGSNNILIMDLIDQGKLQYERGVIHREELLAALPGITPGTTPFAHELYLISSAGGQRTSYSTPTYLGKVYADFGPIGTWIVFLGVGIALGLAQHLLLHERRSILGLPLKALLIVAVGGVSRSGISSVGPAVAIGGAVAGYLWLTTWLSASMFGYRPKSLVRVMPSQALK